MKPKTFIELFVALVSGDDAKVKAIKVQKQANSAVKTRLAVYEGELLDKEQKLEDAEENLISASLNFGKEIEDRVLYVDTLLNYKNKVTEAEIDLENLKAKISFLSKLSFD